MPTITSPNNPRVKLAVRLRTRRGRRQQDRIIIDGPREIRRALDSGVRIVEAFVFPGDVKPSEHAVIDPLVRQLREAGVSCWEVTDAVFQRVSYGDRADGVVAIAETPNSDLSSWTGARPSLVAVLEGIEKPGNVGAILRSADAAGIDGVIVANPATDLYNPNTIRASLGALFSLPVFSADSDTVRAWLRRHGLHIVVARVDGSIPLHQVSLRQPCAVVLGSESDGVSSHWREADMQAVRLPMLGTVDSLNVSVTAAVIFYEALRQRQTPTPPGESSADERG